MREYPKILTRLLGISLLQCLPMLLHAQFPNAGYSPIVPTTVGASVAPVATVVPIEPDLVQEVLPVETIPTAPSVVTPSVVTVPVAPSPPIAPVFPSSIFEDRAFLPKGPELPREVLEILDFWFGFLPNPAYFPENKVPIWFGSSPEISYQVRENFSQAILNAGRGEYNNWRETPRGRLALILLLDQFTRHIYQNRPQSFIFDRMARALVLEGLQKGDDKYLYPIERAFFYLPLEHSEDPNMQALSVANYQQLLADAPTSLKPQMQSFLQSAIFHQQQVARFGRFPHRNAILGRQSTPEEVVFLNQWERPSS